MNCRGVHVARSNRKIGCVRKRKESIGIRDNQKIRVGLFESMCNPIAQAFLLNDEQTNSILSWACVSVMILYS
jgi:uncharacterized metal-binding protein